MLRLDWSHLDFINAPSFLRHVNERVAGWICGSGLGPLLHLEILDIGVGQSPPNITIEDIDHISFPSLSFSGTLGICYSGDAYVELKVVVDGNPVSSRARNTSITEASGDPSSASVIASQRAQQKGLRALKRIDLGLASSPNIISFSLLVKTIRIKAVVSVEANAALLNDTQETDDDSNIPAKVLQFTVNIRYPHRPEVTFEVRSSVGAVFSQKDELQSFVEDSVEKVISQYLYSEAGSEGWTHSGTLPIPNTKNENPIGNFSDLISLITATMANDRQFYSDSAGVANDRKEAGRSRRSDGAGRPKSR